MAVARKTKGRRIAWSCFHKGFGKFCHRCAQAEQLTTQADALAQKPNPLPDFVKVQKAEKATETSPALQAGVLVKSGGHRVFASTYNRSLESALSQVVSVMREYAQKLKARPKDKYSPVSV